MQLPLQNLTDSVQYSMVLNYTWLEFNDKHPVLSCKLHAAKVHFRLPTCTLRRMYIFIFLLYRR